MKIAYCNKGINGDNDVKWW